MPKICEVVECHNRASYGFIGDFKAVYCCSHKKIEKDLIDIREKKRYCKSCYLVQGSYGYLDDKKNRFCANCKNEDMVDLKNKKCLLCNKIPIFGNPNDKTPSYCKIHKLENMIDVKSKRCLLCDKQPIYGNPNDKTPSYCKIHKLENMIDVISKRCLLCDKQPIYGNSNDKLPSYCVNHKLDGMIDIKNKRCLLCDKQPSFGFLNDKIASYCGNHKLENMINVISKRCLLCDKRPNFGNLNDKSPSYCGNHKLDGMIDIKNKRCLLCDRQPSFGNPNDKSPSYCGNHKLENMIDIKHKICLTPLCDKQQQLENLCYRCFYALNPNDKRCKRIKIKENEVKIFIQNEFKDLSFIYDEPIKGEGLCFNIRPDILLNLNNHSIIIEIDENQHKFYNSICDNSRTHKIQESLNRPIIIIRFNPDDYIDENNKKIKSPFIIDKKMGLTTIPKNKKLEWNNRLLKLKETIKDNLELIDDKPIKIIKLFYD